MTPYGGGGGGGYNLPKNPLNTYKVKKRDVVQSLRHDCVVSRYQPIVDHLSEKVIGYEALSRPWWRKDLNPEGFFRRAAESGMSYAADNVALPTCCRDVLVSGFSKKSLELWVNVLPSTLLTLALLETYEVCFEIPAFLRNN
ncbi:EAL domain-containing protein [Alicyclobacillus sp. SO9]|nr:EAL domain-containing protein [Alicyclobacillus sp. SO9]